MWLLLAPELSLALAVPLLSKVLVLFHNWVHLGILAGALSYLMAKPSLAQKEGMAWGSMEMKAVLPQVRWCLLYMCHAESHLFIYIILIHSLIHYTPTTLSLSSLSPVMCNLLTMFRKGIEAGRLVLTFY